MGQNKEQLNKLLQFIKRLIEEPGNEEFVHGLQELLSAHINQPADDSKLADIEKYLGLDYKLDSAIPDIDYSFIKIDYARDQLISDYREMLRYRFGVRSHKIDFSEFCRYAMMQVEQLLNYYYLTKFSTIEEIKDYINKHLTWINLDRLDSVKALSLSAKLAAFPNKLKKKTVLDYAREVRNEQSHRSSEKEIIEVQQYQEKLLQLGLPLTKEGVVSGFKVKEDATLRAKFESLNKSEYWKYCYQLWRLREPFDDVIEAVKELSANLS